jgi:pSer/pThr/pTyr-binding forkhead associated (FHA) protein
MLTVRSGGIASRYRLGAASLERGILVGRYARCELATAAGAALESALSRVHLLLVRENEVTLAVDTASTNGTTIGGKKRRGAMVSDGDVLNLGDELELVYESIS